VTSVFSGARVDAQLLQTYFRVVPALRIQRAGLAPQTLHKGFLFLNREIFVNAVRFSFPGNGVFRYVDKLPWGSQTEEPSLQLHRLGSDMEGFG
jgi:hypothetical protein